MSSSDLVRRAREMGGFDPAVELCSEMADEIERLRKENEELCTIIDSLRAVFYNGIYVSESRVARLKLARAALGEKQ